MLKVHICCTFCNRCGVVYKGDINPQWTCEKVIGFEGVTSGLMTPGSSYQNLLKENCFQFSLIMKKNSVSTVALWVFLDVGKRYNTGTKNALAIYKRATDYRHGLKAIPLGETFSAHLINKEGYSSQSVASISSFSSKCVVLWSLFLTAIKVVVTLTLSPFPFPNLTLNPTWAVRILLQHWKTFYCGLFREQKPCTRPRGFFA